MEVIPRAAGGCVAGRTAGPPGAPPTSLEVKTPLAASVRIGVDLERAALELADDADRVPQPGAWPARVARRRPDDVGVALLRVRARRRRGPCDALTHLVSPLGSSTDLKSALAPTAITAAPSAAAPIKIANRLPMSFLPFGGQATDADPISRSIGPLVAFANPPWGQTRDT